MRVRVWLLVVCVVLSRYLSVASAEGEPTDTTPVNETVHEHSPIVTDSLPSQQALPEVVTARVYTSPNISAEALRAALQTAEAAFAAASVAITWRICGPAECDTAPSPAELVVRFVSSQGRPVDFRCLGEALIDTERRTGVLATVYLDRVLQLARRLRIDDRILLGWTIGHEIGHLLLATHTHGMSGLMREVWSRKEMRLGRQDDWVVHPFEAAAIRQRLALTRTSRSSSPS